ncbi:MAG TPA: acyl-CoA dehydrogenase family protein [Solirubrobacteraceae bacterium]|jgi:alkylation response protein AidB-like acyl-CoA dehydrogenase|nr:acyl-CoA dehydrogenase family protein [Solirubrobacteraceae bacterium]
MSTTTVTLTADQDEIRDVARRFLDTEYPLGTVRELMAGEGLSGEAWAGIAEMGWAGIAVAEELGGAGYGDVERVVLMEEMGCSLLPGPFLSSAVLASDLLSALGAVERLVPLIAGERRATVVAAGDLHGGDSVAGAVRAEGTSTLHGRGGLVLDAHEADELLVAAALEDDGGVGVFAVAGDAQGVQRTPRALVDETRRAALITFDGAAAERLGDGDQSELLRGALERSTVALAAEQVGGARQALEITLAYMRDRHQFGVPIGSFQALKHRACDLGVAVQTARETVLFAVDALALENDRVGAARAVSAAKAAASDTFVKVTTEGIQLHGGIGFTQECDIGLYYKRAVVSAAVLGSSIDHRARLAASFDL